MTEVERAKEYLLNNLTEDKIDQDLTDIALKFAGKLHTREVFFRLIGEIQAYMEIQLIENRVDYWYIVDLDHVYDITNYEIITVFSVCNKELKFKIDLHI